MTWKLVTDYLRCNPSFHGRARNDGVIISLGGDDVFFAILEYVFTCAVGEDVQPLALIHPLDARTGTRLRKDKDLGLYRVRAQPLPSCRFVSVHCIIRGAMLVPDQENYGDYFVVDTVDTDMFLRMKTVKAFSSR